MASGYRRISIALGAALACAGLAAAQGLAGDAPLPSAAEVSAYDSQAVVGLLAAARSGDGVRVRALLDQTTDPLVRKIALWALADATP